MATFDSYSPQCQVAITHLGRVSLSDTTAILTKTDHTRHSSDFPYGEQAFRKGSL